MLDAISDQRSEHTPLRREITVLIREFETARAAAEKPFRRAASA